MKQKEFEQLVETYGANPQRWPAEQRAGAQAFLDGTPVAREKLAAARALDAALDRAAPATPREAAERVVERAMEAVRFLPQGRTVEPFLPGVRAATARWLSAGVLSGAVAAGLAFGFVLHSQPNISLAIADETENTAVSLVFARSLTLYAEAE